MRYIRIFFILLISSLLLFSSAPVESQDYNFTTQLLISSADPIQKTLALLIKQSLVPLLINVDEQGYPDLEYQAKLDQRDFDMMILSHEEGRARFPPIGSTYSSNSFTGQVFLGLQDPNLMHSAGINISDMDTLVNQYQQATNKTSKINAAYNFQEYYNDKVLLDIPIYSPAISVLHWSNFVGFDPNEDLMGSLFLGAHWDGNHAEREQLARTTDELHLKVKGFENLVNPLFYTTRSQWQISDALYPTLLKMDKNTRAHPDLAISFNITQSEDGSSSYMFNLRKDAFWTDGEPVNADDIKFTFDLLSFPWVGTTDHKNWEQLQEVRIINSTVIEVTFKNSRYTNLSTISNAHILPEHILNVTGEIEGKFISPYSGSDPTVLPSWKEFLSDPVTAGPYKYNKADSDSSFLTILEENNDYWFPNENDAPNNRFDLTQNDSTIAYYFQDGDLPIKRLVYHPKEFDKLEETVYRDLEFQKFQKASYDLLEFQYFLQDQEVKNDERWTVQSVPVPGSGVTLLLNLDKAEFKKYDVRLAIAKVLNRADIATILGYGWKIQNNPVSQFYPDYYNPSTEILEDDNTAMQLFQNQGYQILDSNADQGVANPLDKVPIDPYTVIIALSVSLLVQRKRKFSHL